MGRASIGASLLSGAESNRRIANEKINHKAVSECKFCTAFVVCFINFSCDILDRTKKHPQKTVGAKK